MLPTHLQNLITQFLKLPGIGPRQAARFAFYLMRNTEQISALSKALALAGESTKLCSRCHIPAYNPGGENMPLCSICSNQRRDGNLICIVEKETDALNFEKSGYFQGHYYILGGFINPLEENELAKTRTNVLLNRLKSRPRAEPVEFILAFSPRREGDFTASYIESKLGELQDAGHKIKITRLGRGLSTGAELEYADQETLKNAFEGRK